MRSQALAVSLVLLLIAVATLPGISFSLSSSVTSYNNQITFINDRVSMGFYGQYNDGQYSDIYTGTPFDQAKLSLEKVKDRGGNVTGYRTFTDYRSMSDTNNVFFQLKGANSFNITASFAYEDGYTGLKILDKARLIMKPLSGGDPRTVEFKDTDINGGTLILSGLDASTGYLLDIEVGCTTQKTVSIGESTTYIPLIITFTASYDQSGIPLSETFGGSHVGFAIVEQEYNGITVDDSHEFREPASNDPNNPPAGAVVVSNKGNADDSFIGKGNSATMAISTDGNQRFKFYIYTEGHDTGLSKNSKYGFKIDVRSLNGTLLATIPTQGNNGDTFLLGSGYIGKYGYSNTASGVNWFDSAITITITANQENSSGKADMFLYIIFENNTTEQSRSSTNTQVAMATREEEFESIEIS